MKSKNFKYHQAILSINREKRRVLLYFFSEIEMVKTKLKPILPSLREKKRYLVFEVISKVKISNADAVSDEIWRSSLQFLGQLGVAKAGLIVLNNKWSSKLQRGILKVSHRHVDNLKASLAFATKIDGKDVIFRSIGVSGILNKAERNYLKSAS